MTESTWQISWKSVVLSVITASVFFAALELVFSIFGVETLIERGDPSRGFSGLVSVFERDGDVYRTRRFGDSSPFNEQTFLANKPHNGLRIFTLGGSSAYGHPWGAQVAFTALLGETIAGTRPDRHVEAINVGGVSYAMGRVGLVAEEIWNYAPDIVIIFSGHNEFAEPLHYRDFTRRSPQRNRLELAASHTRIYTVLRRLLVDRRDPDESPQSRFDLSVRRTEAHAYDSTQRDEVAEEFRTGLRRIVRRAHERGVNVLLATLPANLSQWKPNHSIVDSPLDEAQRSSWAGALAAGRSKLVVGAFGDAVVEFRRAIGLAPHHAESHYLLGQANEGLQQWERARHHYGLAADHDASPIRRTSAINRAISSVATAERALWVDIESIFVERSEHGLVGFNWIDDYAHPTVEGHQIIAWQLFASMEEAGWLGRGTRSGPSVFAQVLASREAETRSPPPAWLYNQGYLFAHQGQNRRAIAKFQEAVAIAPSFEPALVNLAQLLFSEGEVEQASRIVEQLLGRYPENVGGRVLKGVLLARSGSDEKALAEFRRAIVGDPNFARAHLQLGNLMLKNRELDEAGSAFARAIEIDPNFVDAALGLARTLEAAGDREAAVVQYRAIIRNHPSSALAHHELGVLLHASGGVAEAIRFLSIAANLAPESPESRIALGVLQFRAGNHEDSTRQLRLALGIDPDSLVAYNYLGLALHAAGELEESARSYREALRIDPGFAEAHANLGRALADSHQPDLAIEQYREAVRLRPSWSVPYNNLAWILATDPDSQRRDPTRALSLAKRALELTGHPTASTLDTLAAAQAAANHFDQAAATAMQAVELARERGAEDLAAAIERRRQGYENGEAHLADASPDSG